MPSRERSSGVGPHTGPPWTPTTSKRTRASTRHTIASPTGRTILDVRDPRAWSRDREGATTTVSTLLATDALTFGAFRCAPADPRWHEENRIGDGHHVVFPRRAVRIGQAGHRPWVTDPNHAVFYDAGQTYRRGLVSPDGDRCWFVALAPGTAQELLAIAPGADDERFGRAGGPLDDRAALRIHLLARELEAGSAQRDPWEVEAALVETLAEVVAGPTPLADRPRIAPGRPATVRAHRTLVEDAKAHLALAFADRRSIRSVATAIGASPFHLARVFRAATGSSLHAYRDRLRLRAALDRIADGEADLARLAQDLGYASHSHLDGRFREVFGRPPSSLRRPGVADLP